MPRSRSPILMAAFALAASACSTFPYASQSGSISASAGTRYSASASAGPVSITLTAEQAASVRAYYGRQSPSKGRGRKGGLPPGIAKNLQRGKPLPPGIAMQHLPDTLLVSLPRPGNGLEYVVAAGKLLLIDAATQMVRQVLLDSVFG